MHDQSECHLKTLHALLEALEVFNEQPELWCRNDAECLLFLLRAALREVEYGTYQSYVCFDYPADMPPPENEDGCASSGLMMNTGFILRLAAERAQYMTSEERLKVRQAINFYPDEGFELEVSLENSAFCVTDLTVMERPIPASSLHPAIGSVSIDHYGSASKFSSDPHELGFRLHRPAGLIHGEDLADMCFLISNDIAYAASLDVA